MPKTKTRKSKTTPETVAIVSLIVNGHVLSGERPPESAVWAWQCADWPDLVADRAGNDSPAAVCGDFLMRALLRPAA